MCIKSKEKKHGSDKHWIQDTGYFYPGGKERNEIAEGHKGDSLYLVFVFT